MARRSGAPSLVAIIVSTSRGRPAVGFNGRDDRIDFAALGCREHGDAVLGLAGTQELRVVRTGLEDSWLRLGGKG
jgi:hypothetical protein